MGVLASNPVFIVSAALTLILVVPWVAHYWHKVCVAEVNAALKLEMVRRGMSAEEIKAVLEAHP